MITEPSTQIASTSSLIDAERCIAELQRGRAVALYTSPEDTVAEQKSFQIIQLVETMDARKLEAVMSMHGCQLILSRSRATALGLMADSNAFCFDLAPHTSVDTVRDWAGLNPAKNSDATSSQGVFNGSDSVCSNESAASLLQQRGRAANIQYAKAALNLAHHAHVLPAFVTYAANAKPDELLSVSSHAAINYRDQSGELIMLSKARIPLAAADSVELTVFRERHGNAEHVAITVGQPEFSGTVTVRLHSSCFTGDILGSLKCDCGEQLQRAISTMAEGDGGVVLYVSQEGRGIGLASKLLAYQLQDQGLDTIEANQHLGFDADERHYHAAVHMLEKLGIGKIHLMTNNPLKIDALREHGVHVESRVPSPATANEHNARYLATKRERAGHLTSCEAAG